MIILAIETSCDDTCVAVVEAKGQKSPSFKILSNIISSQVKIHKKWGGVYPTLAKREHKKNLPTVFKKALNKAGNPSIDLIAITIGPGLEPCLWVGVNFAVELAKKLNLPILPINHIEAHILANTINNQQLTINNFPAMCLVISGGHTQLILMKNIGKYKILGETRDDAAGECLDKVARILGLGYPGGPAIAAEAAKFKVHPVKSAEGGAKQFNRVKSLKFKVELPRPMIYQKNYDFSFSGLKTAVLYDFKNRPEKIRKSKQYIKAMCAEVQKSIIDVLIHKTLKAAKEYRAKSIILGGGVAANEELRKQFNEKIKKEIPNSLFLIPNSKFCTDNAAMVAVTGYFNWAKKKDWKEIKANANLRIEEKL